MTVMPTTTGRTALVTEDPGGATATIGIRKIQREMTHERLVHSAAKSFAARGYVATTIDDITAGAGATRATFYLHFKSKAEVVVQVLAQLRGEYRSIYESLAFVVEQSNAESIHRWLDATVQIWERTARMSSVASEAATMEPAVQQFRIAEYERDITLLQSALERRKQWDLTGCRVRAVVLFSQLEQIFERWTVTGWDVDRDVMVLVLTTMWCAALEIPMNS